jgi:hypothetical protein
MAALFRRRRSAGSRRSGRAPSGSPQRQVDEGVSLLAGAEAAGAAAGALEPPSPELVLAGVLLLVLPPLSLLLLVVPLFDVDE